jgi:hypothetical protein
MRLKADLHALARALRKQGWDVSRTNGGHILWMSPTGDRIYGASTSGGGRGDRNLKAQLKKAGAKL